MASNPPGAGHKVALANLYFDLGSKNAEGKVKCRKCDAVLRGNSSHGNLAAHVRARHSSCWKEELERHLRGATRIEFGYMDSYHTVTRIVTVDAKMMN